MVIVNMFSNGYIMSNIPVLILVANPAMVKQWAQEADRFFAGLSVYPVVKSKVYDFVVLLFNSKMMEGECSNFISFSGPITLQQAVPQNFLQCYNC